MTDIKSLLPQMMEAARKATTFEIGCRVRPRAIGLVEGELVEFNADVTGARIRWDNRDETWKALRNLEVVCDYRELSSPSNILALCNAYIALEGERDELEQGWGHSRMEWAALVQAEIDKRVAAEARLKAAETLAGEAEIQITYLHEKFGETGSGNAMLARLRDFLGFTDNAHQETQDG